MKVYIIQHVHELLDEGRVREDVKFIGVYSTLRKARAATKRLKSQSGFCDSVDGFHIDAYTVDQDNWVEGFVTVKHGT